MPMEPTSRDIPQQTEYLWNLKSAIKYSETVGVIVSVLEGPLENLERESFTEDDWKLVQLVLTLFRNILGIQDISVLQKVGGSASHFAIEDEDNFTIDIVDKVKNMREKQLGDLAVDGRAEVVNNAGEEGGARSDGASVVAKIFNKKGSKLEY